MIIFLFSSLLLLKLVIILYHEPTLLLYMLVLKCVFNLINFKILDIVFNLILTNSLIVKSLFWILCHKMTWFLLFIIMLKIKQVISCCLCMSLLNRNQLLVVLYLLHIWMEVNVVILWCIFRPVLVVWWL